MTTRTKSSTTLLRLGGKAAYATAVVAPIGLAFLAAMYIAFAVGARSQGFTFGWINDALAVVTGLLMVPVVVAVHVLLRERAPQASRLALIVGIGANVAIATLQSLLVAGVLTFEQEIGPVLIAFLALVIWFVATGFLGSSAGVLPHGVRMSVLAATYLGYPFWAIWLGRLLIRGGEEPDRAPWAGESPARDPRGMPPMEERSLTAVGNGGQGDGGG